MGFKIRNYSGIQKCRCCGSAIANEDGTMKVHLSSKLISLCLATALWSTSAHAVSSAIQIAYTPVTTQPDNNGDDTLAAWASGAITTYNNLYNAGPDLPALPALAFKVNPGDPTPVGFTFGFGVTSISLNLTGNTYIILGWGGTDIPNDSGTAINLYYIPTSDTYDFTAQPNASGGLSSIHVYGGGTPGDSVPDAGATIALLSIGLAGIEAARRKLRR
jgi:hypothetical protein